MSPTPTSRTNIARLPVSGSNFNFTHERLKKAIARVQRFKSVILLRDDRQQGLCLKVRPTGGTTFLVEKRHQRRLYHVKLGDYTASTDIDAMRAAASAVLLDIYAGRHDDKVAERKAKAVEQKAKLEEDRAAKRAGLDVLRTMTIADVVESHIADAKPPLRPRTAEGYRLAAKRIAAAGKLTNKPVVQWTAERVRAAHDALAEETTPQSASGYMRNLRAAVGGWRWRFPAAVRPANIIAEGMRPTNKSKWVVAKPRVRSLWAKETKPFIDACETLSQSVSRRHSSVYRLLGLLAVTGMRFLEVAALRWSEVDLDRGMLTLGEARMKGKKVFEKPLGPHAIRLLEEQLAISGGGVFVFPSANKKGGHVDDARHAMGRVCKAAACTAITPHDLRRTYLRAAEACGLPMSRLKALVHHSVGNDVTANYLSYGFADNAGGDAAKVEAFLLEAR